MAPVQRGLHRRTAREEPSKTWRRMAGISGASLGYIYGGLPSAYTGYKHAVDYYDYYQPMGTSFMGKIDRARSWMKSKLHKRRRGLENSLPKSSELISMHPTPAKSTRSRSVSRGRTSKRSKTHRSVSIASTSRSESRSKSSVPSIKTDVSDGFHASVVKKGSKKTVRKVAIKKKKDPKVSKSFVAKVNKALTPTHAHGSYTIVYPEGRVDFTGLNKQLVWDGSNSTNAGVPNDGILHFTTDHFGAVASALFNQMPINFSGSCYNPTFTNRLNIENTKFHVKNSWSTYEIKNNTQRVITLKVIECAPKRAGTYNTANAFSTQWYQNTGGGVLALVSNLVACKTPVACWTDSVGEDFENEYSFKYNNAAFSQLLSINDLHLNPSSSPTFRQVWKSALLKEVVMEPGMQFKFFVQGPSNMELDYKKYWQNGIYMNVQKFSRGILFIAHEDLTSMGAIGAASGRPSDTNLDSKLCIERVDHYRIDVPQQIYGTERKDRYGFDVITTNIEGVPKTIDVDNPVNFIPA